jgi:hypothetical protein
MSEVPGGGDRSALQQRLPFANVDTDETILSEAGGSMRIRPTQKIQRSGSGSNLSASYGHRMPTRSYFYHASHGGHGMLNALNPVLRFQS